VLLISLEITTCSDETSFVVRIASGARLFVASEMRFGFGNVFVESISNAGMRKSFRTVHPPEGKRERCEDDVHVRSPKAMSSGSLSFVVSLGVKTGKVIATL